MSVINRSSSSTFLYSLPKDVTSVSFFQWHGRKTTAVTKKMAVTLLENYPSLQSIFVASTRVATRQEKKNTIVCLPTEIQDSIIEFLDKNALFQLLPTCRLFRAKVMEQLTPGRCLSQSIFSTTLTDKAPNPFNTFCYVPMSQTVITGEFAEYNRIVYPILVSSLTGKTIQRIQDRRFFYKPIQFILFNPHNQQLVVGSRECIQLWKIHRGVLSFFTEWKTGDYKKAITALYYNQDLLCYATQQGEVFVVCVGEKDVSNHKTRIAFARDEYRTIFWLDVNHKAQQLFVKTGSAVSCYSISTNALLYSITTLSETSSPQLDCQRELLIVDQNRKTILFIQSTTGVLRNEFTLPEDDFEIVAFHFDSTSQLLFVALQRGIETKVVIWDAVKKTITRSFFTQSLRKLFYPIEKLDYDSASETVLTAGHGVQLWDVYSGSLLHDFVKKPILKVHWDKAERKLLILPKIFSKEAQPLTIIDYGYSSSASGSKSSKT